MIEVRQVRTKKEQREFLNFPLDLYAHCPYFAPPLYLDEKKIFKPDYYYYKTSDAIYFNAYDEKGKIVGRISAILNKASNKKWNQNRVRFTRFDCIDDQEVADKLFEAAERWAKETCHATEIVGPLGFSDFERQGLLIEGFEEMATFEEQYNYPYYQKLIEHNGYIKDVDWVERKLSEPDEAEEKRIERVVDSIMKRDGFKLLTFKNTNEIIKRYADQFFDLVDETYADLYGTVPFIKEQREDIIQGFRLLLSPFYIRLIVDKDDKLAAYGLCFPSITKALQKSRGHLSLPTIFRILKAKKNPEIIDLGIIGVSSKYRNCGVAWGIFLEIMRYLHTGNIKYCETNLNLEDNTAIINNWNRFKNVLHKRRRCFIKKL